MEMTVSERQKKLLAKVQDKTVKGIANPLPKLMIGLNPVEFKTACDNLSRFFSILKEWDEKEKVIG